MRQAFAGIVDYAGLFPPASLKMPESLRNYEAYRHSTDRWLLGRYVVAAMRLKELHETLISEQITPSPADPWRLSVVFGNVIPNEVKFLDAFKALRPDGSVLVEAVEFRVRAVGAIPVVTSQLPQDVEQVLEVPKEGPYSRLIQAIRHAGATAKLRTGGSTPEMFPAPEAVIAFITGCVSAELPFKFTAGLHHPFRGVYPLTYQPEPESHWMYGFVPLLLATTQIVRGGDAALAQAMIEDDDVSAFQRDADGFAWRDQRFSLEDIAAARRAFVSFGSCSFKEPLDGIGQEITS